MVGERGGGPPPDLGPRVRDSLSCLGVWWERVAVPHPLQAHRPPDPIRRPRASAAPVPAADEAYKWAGARPITACAAAGSDLTPDEPLSSERTPHPTYPSAASTGSRRTRIRPPDYPAPPPPSQQVSVHPLVPSPLLRSAWRRLSRRRRRRRRRSAFRCCLLCFAVGFCMCS